MTALLDAETRAIVQGITGHQGSFHAVAMKNMGTNVVGGTSPGRGGSNVNGIPVFETAESAVRETGANASVVFVPARAALGAVIEALDAGISTVAVITEHIPEHDAVVMVQYAKLTGARIIGPNCPGIAAPRHGKLGIMPSTIFMPGDVAVVSRSGTLTYEIVNALTQAGIGESTCVGIGGDPVVGTDFVRMLELLEQDDETEAVVLVGEIGGSAEEDAAKFIHGGMSKPVIAYIAGRTAPPEKRMGHAGAIIARGKGTAEDKIASLNSAGVEVAALPKDVPDLVKAAMR